jgi:xanthosine utilization system XapX-like protein
MTRLRRIALAAGTLAGSVGLVLALLLLGSAAEGPLATLFGHLGVGVGELESRMARTLRGPGRAADLAWLGPMRDHADSLRHPDALLLGVYDDGLPTTLEHVVSLERALETRFALIQVYTAWGDAADQRFPGRIVEAIHDLGSIPVVTWEPWLTSFESRRHPHLPLRDQRDRDGLAAIARGDYDFYVDTWAREAARFGQPVFVRLGHEMNDPYRYPWGPHNNSAEHFIAAWRRVVDRFRAAGANDVLWVWSPHTAYAGYEAYWPGGDYVDWVATGGLNYGTVAYWSRWWSFDEIFGRHYDFLEGFGKPIMVAEVGSLAIGGDRAAWYREAFTHVEERFPAVRALVLFHSREDATVTPQRLDWSILDDADVRDALREALRTPES